MSLLSKYFARAMSYAGDIMPLARDLENPEVMEPTAIAKTETDCSIFQWKKEMTNYILWKNMLESNLKAVYMSIWEQCSKALRAKVKSLSQYNQK